MSHHSYFAMAVFDRRDSSVKDYLLSDAFASMLGVATAADEPAATDFAALRRHMSGTTRSDWVKAVSKTLLDAAGSLDSLRFISEQTYTHRQFDVSGEKAAHLDADTYGSDIQFTVFERDDFEIVIADIQRFIRWCANNVLLVERLIEYNSEAGILDAIYHTPASDRPTEFDDEGQGIHCLLSTFKTVRDFLLHARRHGLSAVYMNLQPTSWEWYRKSVSLDESHPGYRGKLHKNESYVRPARSRQLLPAFPPQGLPIDVPALLATATPEQREQAKMIRPIWADGHPLAYLFEHEPTLMSSGRVVWGAYVQANMNLFEPIYRFGAPGDVIYDPAGRMSPGGLSYEAVSLFRWKGNQYGTGREQFFAQHLANERTTIFGEEWISEGYPLKVSSTYFDQLHLPDGMVTLRHFPVLISDACPGAAMVLPCQFWPPALREEWMQASEKKFGRRYTALQLRDAAFAQVAARQAEFDADPSPFNLHGPSLYEEGLLHFHGRGIPQNLDKARRLWEKAASMGHPESMNNLGVMYSEGEGVPKNLHTAFSWYQRAAEKGHPLGQLNLGKMHLLVDGIEPDLIQAQFWLEKAAEQGNEEAKQLLVDFQLAERQDSARGLLDRLLKKWLH